MKGTWFWAIILLPLHVTAIQYYRIRWGSVCVSVLADQTSIETLTCADTADNQQWIVDFTNKGFSWKVKPSYCLSPPSNTNTDGLQVQLQSCASGFSFFFGQRGGPMLANGVSGERLQVYNQGDPNGHAMTTVGYDSSLSNFQFLLGDANASLASQLVGTGCSQTGTSTQITTGATAVTCAAAASVGNYKWFGLVSTGACYGTNTDPTLSTFCGPCGYNTWEICGTNGYNAAFFYLTPNCTNLSDNIGCTQCANSVCTACGSSYTLSNGKCIALTFRTCIVGGVSTPAGGSVYQSSTECYDPSSSSWNLEPALTLPVATAHLTPFIKLDGTVCVAGGLLSTGLYTNTVLCLNPSSTNLGWVPDAGLPVATGDMAVMYYNGPYLIGGRTSGGAVARVFKFTGSSWVGTNNLSTARQAAVAFTNSSGTWCVYGGLMSGGGSLSTVECWTGSSWTAGTSLFQSVGDAPAFQYNGQNCIGGGQNGGFTTTTQCQNASGTWALTNILSVPSDNVAGNSISFTLNGQPCLANDVTAYCFNGYQSSWTNTPLAANRLYSAAITYVPIISTSAPTSAPTTSAPTTSAPTTSAPTTSAPTTSAPTTSAPTPIELPTTRKPTTARPTGASTFSPTSPSRAPTTTPQGPTTLPTPSPTTAPTTLSPTTAPTTLSPTTSPTTLFPTTSPTPPTTIYPTTSKPTSSPIITPSPTPPTTIHPTTPKPTTASPLTSGPTNSPVTIRPTLAPTPTGAGSSLAGSKLTAGGVAGIVVGLIVVAIGVILCVCIIRKGIKLKDLTSKLKIEQHENGPKDPREAALDGTIKLCEQILKGSYTTAQNKLYLQYVVAGAKEDKHTLSSSSASGIEMTSVITAADKHEQGLRVFNMEDFDHSTFLSQGEGGSADLYKEKATGGEVVIKVPHFASELETEAKVWRAIGLHPNVARMIGIVNLNNKPRGIVMEYYPGGSLDSAVQEFSANELHRIAIDLARGLQCLHAHKVIHRDLAARNILVARDRRVVITDFGLSRKLDENDTYKMVSDTKLPWRTLAPELLLTENSGRVFTEKTDIWALGVTLWELATKRSAYAEAAEKDVFKVLKEKIGNGIVKLDLTPIIMNHQKLAPALVGCFNRDPALRPTAEQLRWLLKDDNAAEVSGRANYIAAVHGGEYA